MPQLKAIGRYNRLAMRAANQDRCDEALWYLSLASRLAREVDRPLLEAVTKNNLGIVFQMSARPREAALCFHMALNLARDPFPHPAQNTAPAQPGRSPRRGVGPDHPLCRVIRANLDRLNIALEPAAA